MRAPNVTDPPDGASSAAIVRIRCDLPVPLGPTSPTRSPKCTSAVNGSTNPSTSTSSQRNAMRPLSAPTRFGVMRWRGAGAGGGPASTYLFQRVSAASARDELPLEAARCFMIL